MNHQFNEGDVVICGTGQAGTIHYIAKDVCILLANGDLWHGDLGLIRKPQSAEDLAACPLEVDKFVNR